MMYIVRCYTSHPYNFLSLSQSYYHKFCEFKQYAISTKNEGVCNQILINKTKNNNSLTLHNNGFHCEIWCYIN